MANLKGLCSYCQECGACFAAVDTAVQDGSANRLVDIVTEEVARAMGSGSGGPGESAGLPPIPLGVSNRHIHITRATFVKLFGEESDLQVYRELFQTGEFASTQQVTLVGSKMRAIENVRILGPYREYDQAEISLTDAIGLGIKPPVRNSGDLNGAAPLTLVGPKGSVFLEACAIIATRHIHMPPEKASLYGVQDGSLCRVRIGGVKPTLFENVLVRVKEGYKLQMHLDTDDANAANVRCNTGVEFAGLMEG